MIEIIKAHRHKKQMKTRLLAVIHLRYEIRVGRRFLSHSLRNLRKYLFFLHWISIKLLIEQTSLKI